MDIFYTVGAARVIFILGILNILAGMLVFLSCRCLTGLKYGGFRRFYKYHCYIWWFFWPAVMVHAILALILFGWPG